MKNPDHEKIQNDVQKKLMDSLKTAAQNCFKKKLINLEDMRPFFISGILY